MKTTDKGEDNRHEKPPAENDAINVKPKAYLKENETGRKKDFHGVDIHNRAANELEKIDGITDGLDLRFSFSLRIVAWDILNCVATIQGNQG